MGHQDDLLKFSACEGMKPAELKQLAEAIHWREYKAGEVLFREGQKATTMFFVFEGTVSIALRRDGREEVLAQLGPRSIFGEMGAVLDETRSADAIAETDIRVGMLHRQTLLEWIGGREYVALHLILNLLRIMATRIRRVNAKLFELGVAETANSHMQAELAEFRQKLFTSWSF